MALGFNSRNGKRAIWIAIHTAEGSRTKESLFSYFDSSQAGSSHAGIDAGGIGVWLSDTVAAWTMLGGNPYAIQAELCGFARWTRAQWLSEADQDGCKSPRQMLRNTSRWIADVAKRTGIQVRRLTDAQIRGRSETGVLGHGDYSRATGDGDHTDPGPNFPWDVVLADALAILNPAPGPTEEEENDPMFQIVQVPASPADGFTKATVTVALPWVSKDGSSYTGIKRQSLNVVAGDQPVSVFAANWRTNPGTRQAVPFDVGTLLAFSDSGGRAVPNQTYAVTLEYVSKSPFSLILEVSR